VKTPSADPIAQAAGVARSRWLEPAALIVIVAVAVGLRFWAIGFGFPERVRPDEQYFVQCIQRFDRLETLDPDWYYYPSFYMYLNLAVWRGYTLYHFFRGDYEVPDARRGQPASYGLDRIRADRAAGWPNSEFLLGRCLTACFGVAIVLVAYGLTRRFYGRKAATAAAFLLAINGLHTLNSHFYKSDIATTFFTLAALGCMARYIQERRLGWNLGAAIMTGLATSTNYYGGFLLLPLLVSQFMAHCSALSLQPSAFSQAGSLCYPEEAEGQRRQAGEEKGGGPAELTTDNRQLITDNPKSEIQNPKFKAVLGALLKGLVRWETYAMPAIALAAFVVTSPYCFIRWAEFLNVFHRMVFADRQSLYDTLVKVINFDDFGFQQSPLIYSVRFCLRHSMGFVLGFVSVAGLVFLAVRRRAVGWLLLLFFVVHFFMTASGKAIFMRYYLSLVPILTIGAGVLLSWAVRRLVPGRWRTQDAVLVVALAVCGFESLWCSVQQNRLLAREDTRVEAREWLAKNLPAGALVGTPVDWWKDFYPYGKPTLPAGCRYLAVAPADVRAKRVRYLVVDDLLLRLYSPPERRDWPSWLASNARLLFEVTPYDRPVEEIRARYDQLDAFYVPVARFGGIVRPGPRIRVYEVRSLP